MLLVLFGNVMEVVQIDDASRHLGFPSSPCLEACLFWFCPFVYDVLFLSSRQALKATEQHKLAKFEMFTLSLRELDKNVSTSAIRA